MLARGLMRFGGLELMALWCAQGRMRQAEKETFEQKQNDIRHWIEAATKESFPAADFFQSLRSGVLLCKYVSLCPSHCAVSTHTHDD
jgi:hypothetical protein